MIYWMQNNTDNATRLLGQHIRSSIKRLTYVQSSELSASCTCKFGVWPKSGPPIITQSQYSPRKTFSFCCSSVCTETTWLSWTCHFQSLTTSFNRNCSCWLYLQCCCVTEPFLISDYICSEWNFFCLVFFHFCCHLQRWSLLLGFPF